MKNRINAVVNFASPVHQTPQTGFAQIMPEMSITAPNITPTSAIDTASRSQRSSLLIRYTTLATATPTIATILAQADGTCRYRIR